MPRRKIRTINLKTDAELVAISAAAADAPAPLPRLTIIAYTGEPLTLAGWDLPVVIDTAGIGAEPPIPILLDHTPEIDNIVGQADQIDIQPGLITIKAQTLNDSPKITQFVKLASRGMRWQASLGATPTEIREIPQGETIQANDRQYEGPLYLVTKAKLREVSIVLFGADPNTDTLIGAQPMNAHAQHDAAPDNPTPKNDAPAQPEQKTAPTPETIRAEIAAELARIAQIQKLAANYPEIAAKAVAENWDITRTELEILRASRPIPAIHVKDETPLPKAIEAALCQSAGIPDAILAKHYDEKTLELASRRYRRAGLHALIYETIFAAGRYAKPGIMDEDTIRTAFEIDRQISAASAFSTITVSGILQNVANRIALESYSAVNAVAPVIAMESDVPDFKQAIRYRMTGLDSFEKVPPTGELKLASLGDTVFTNQADTYGAVLTLSRQMIINDDLGAFLQLPRMMGRRAAIAREKAVFELLLANPNNFFSTTNKNLLSGADTALSIAGLTKAEQQMSDQTDNNGLPILITPAILLVPTSLKVLAQQLMTETRVNETTATGKPSPANNPHAGKWQPVASPYLNAMGLSGSSPTAWYLLANPQDVAAIEIVYVQGRRQPTIETAEADFKTLGMSFRAYWDFGVALQDPKAIVKSTGA